MDNVYLEALQNYLNGSEWRQSVEMFVQSNCKYFHNITELDHQQYELWRSFQEIVENILEMALVNVGGSIEMLEASLEQVYRNASRGPRDDLVKDVLDRLLSFSDFETFAKMMKAASDEQTGEGDDKKSTIDSLLRMGFPTAAIDAVLEKVDPSVCSVEDLVAHLSMYISGEGDRGRFAEEDEEEFKLQMLQLQADQHAVDFVDPHDPNTVINSPSKGISKALLKFIDEAQDEGISIDVNELNAKFVIADSVLDTFDSSTLDEMPITSLDSSSGGIVGLLRWAEQMKLLYHDILTAYNEQLPGSSMCFNFPDGLIAWYRSLEDCRRELEQEQGAGSMVSSSELHRMAELDRIAAMGTADEQLLHSLISRHDEVLTELNKLHRKCGIVIASERYMQRLNLEELYLYLKQQVATGTDLEVVTDNLQEETGKVVSSAKGMEVINLLLDMHIYEEEEMMLRSRIHELTGSLSPIGAKYSGSKLSPPRHGGSSQFDANAETDATGSPSVIAGGLLRFNDVELDGLRGLAFVNMENDPLISSDQDMHHHRQHSTDNDMMAADSKSKEHQQRAAIGPLFAADEGDGSHLNNRLSARQDDTDTSHFDAIKQQHRIAIGNLKELLEHERASRLQALDDKLIRRRALLKKAQQAAGEDGEALVEEHAAAVREVEEELKECSRSIDTMKESMVAGFKKLCQAEIQCADAMARGSDSSDRKDSKGDASQLQLSDEMNDVAQRKAAEALKEKHRRDYEALMQSLEHERDRQRKRITQALAAKRGRAGVENGIVDTTGWSAEEKQELQDELQRMNQEFDAHESKALTDAQDRTLVSLSAIYMNKDLLKLPSSHDDKHDDDDELEEDQKRASNWLKDIERNRAQYANASSLLQQRLLIQSAVSADGESDPSSLGAAAADVSQVIVDAFLTHLQESVGKHGSDGRAGSRNREGDDDLERVKQGIVNEFHKAKSKADSSLQNSKNTSRNRLEERRKRKLLQQQQQQQHNATKGDGADPGAKDEDDDDEDEVTLDLFLDVMHGFIENKPLPVPAGASSRAGKSNSNAFTDPNSIEERTRIKKEHAEREKQLLNDLQANMLSKKKNLEDRLRRKRAAEDKKASDEDHADGVEGADNVHALAEDVHRLEEAFKKVASMIEDVNQEDLAQLDIKQLLELMDRAAHGEAVSVPKNTQASRSFTNATVQRQAELCPNESEGKTSSTRGQASAVSMLPPIQDREPSQRSQMAPRPTLHSSSTLDKLQMADEVQRISMQYNQEQQKHELMMKIQQTRQRQALQKKLLAKNQAKARSNDLHGGAGYSSSSNNNSLTSVPFSANIQSIAPEKSKLASAGKESVLIGVGGASYQRTNIQPVVRGLGEEAYSGEKPTSLTAAPTNKASKSMTARGMNLTPMLGRK